MAPPINPVSHQIKSYKLQHRMEKTCNERPCHSSYVIRFFIFAVLITSFLPAYAFAEIYKWVDEQGRVHYGDRARSQNKAEQVELESETTYWKPYEIEVQWDSVDLTKAEIERIANDVNNVYRFYDHVIYFDMYKTVPVKIRIFPNSTQYYEYIHQVTKKPPTPSWGVFIFRTNEIVVYMREQREKTFNTIKHETSHAILYTMARRTPVWLNEGMAELMEHLVNDDGQLVIHPHRDNAKVLRRAKEKNKLDDIERFLDLQSKEWTALNHGGNYFFQSMAGEFIFFLFSSNTDRTFVRNLLQNYKRGGNLRSLYLVDEYYLGGRGSLNLKWRNWLLKTNHKSIHL